MSAIEMIAWERLTLWPGNPRKRVDAGALRDLAASIAANGVLQNLVARPGRPRNDFEVITGQRRWRAVGRLVDDGVLPAGYEVPVRVGEFTDRQALRLATAENVARQEMTPLEEADAFALMLELGDTVESVAELVGVSPATVKRRLALHHRLAPEVRAALEEDRINLGQAAAFTLGEKAEQAALLASAMRHPAAGGLEPARIRESLLGGAVPMDRAIFDPRLYDGPLVRDLFHDRSYAEDRVQFYRLQSAAAEWKLAELRALWAWVEIKLGGVLPIFDYGRDGAPAQAGAIIHLRDDLRVEIHTGLTRRAAPASSSPGSTRGSPAAPSSLALPRLDPGIAGRGQGEGCPPDDVDSDPAQREGEGAPHVAPRRLRDLLALPLRVDPRFLGLIDARGRDLEAALEDLDRDDLSALAAFLNALADMPL